MCILGQYKLRKLLWEIRDALSKVQLDAAGGAHELGYTAEEVTAGRRVLIEFLEILAHAVSMEKQRPSYDKMTEKELAAWEMVRSQRLRGKWIEEIQTTIQHLLRPEQPWETWEWDVLKQVVDFLQSQVRPWKAYTRVAHP